MNIKPIERSHCNPDRESISVNIDDLNNLEADYKEAIEALKFMVFKDEIYKAKFGSGIVSNIKRLDFIEIIEKAYKYNWLDIRKVLND